MAPWLPVVKGTPALSESVTLRGEAPEGEPCLACCSRRRNSNGVAWSPCQRPQGVRSVPRRGTSVCHRHAMATRVVSKPLAVTGPSLGAPTFASFAGQLPGRPGGIARVKSSGSRAVASRCGELEGKTSAGSAGSKARRLHARCTLPQGRSALRTEESRGSRPAGIHGFDRVSPVSRVIAETNRRRLASNKLAKRTSKKVAGACERWPSWTLFSGAIRGEGSGEETSGRSLRGEHLPRGESRFRGGVTSIAWRSAHRKVRRSRAPRISSSLEVETNPDGSM